jgi:hypothetical protein
MILLSKKWNRRRGNERTNEIEDNIGKPIIASYLTLSYLLLLVSSGYWSSLALYPPQFPPVIYSFTLKIEAIISTEVLLPVYQSTRCHIPEKRGRNSNYLISQIYFTY